VGRPDRHPEAVQGRCEGVASGYECGIGLDGFEELAEGDRIETYSREEVARE
jgi:hypothetical protein